MREGRRRMQGSIEYVIILGGMVVLASATYFMLRGTGQSTADTSLEVVGIAGETFRMDLKNVGKPETRFLLRKWGSFSQISMLLVKNTREPTTTEITLNNLKDYRISPDRVEFAYNDSGQIVFLESKVEDSSVTFTTPPLPIGSVENPSLSEVLVFHDNPNAPKLDNLDYSSSDPDITIVDGTGPSKRKDTTPPVIVINPKAYGSPGSVEEADIEVIVSDMDSKISEVYYSVDDSPYFKADNLYYDYDGIILEAHPEDYNYNSSLEVIHIIATVPEEGDYKIGILAVDEHSNGQEEAKNVSIAAGTRPADTSPPVILDTVPADGSYAIVPVLTINVTTNEIASCKHASNPGIPFSSMSPFDRTSSILHQVKDIPLSDGVEYTYFFRCEDKSGNVNTEDYILNFIKFGEDKTSPSITGSEPLNNSIISSFPLLVNLTTSEKANCRFSNDSEAPYENMTDMDVTGYITHELNLAYGDETYYFKCNDSSGNVNEDPYALNVIEFETLPPVILGTEPLNNSEVYITPITIRVNTSEIARCRYYQTPGTAYSSMTDFSVTDSMKHSISDVSLVNDQEYYYYFRCNDTQGNANTVDYMLRFEKKDIEPPIIYDMGFSAPEPYQEKTLNFTATVYDEEDVAWCSLAVNNSAAVLVDKLMGVVSGEASSVAETFADDLYTALIECADDSGNNNSNSIDFEVDTLNMFRGGSDVMNVSFLEAGSSDVSSRIELPRDSIVLNARLSIEGFVLIPPFGFSYRGGYDSGVRPSGNYNTNLFAGDFNNDGNLDVIMDDRGKDKFHYLAGNGDGNFRSRAEYGAGSQPRGIYAGDFDNDGDLDVIVSNYWSSIFIYFENNGDGTFQRRSSYGTGGATNRLYAGDFNNDGNLDVVTANHGWGSSSFSYLPGRGDGTFGGRRDYYIGHSMFGGGKGIHAGDFNNDGNLDVVVTHAGLSKLFYFQGNGDGTFQTGVSYTTSCGPSDVHAGDFNNDGNLDVVVSHVCFMPPYTGKLAYFPGNGDGTFGGRRTYSTGYGTHGVHVGDFNKDGNLDAVTSSAHSNMFSYLQGNGDGTFQSGWNYRVGGFPSDIFAGDFDNDDDLDVVVVSFTSNRVSFFSADLNDEYYCTNPKLDVGSDGDAEWSYAGEFAVSDTLAGAGFAAELNSFLPECTCPGCRSSGRGANCTITFNLSSDNLGILQLSELAVQHAEPG